MGDRAREIAEQIVAELGGRGVDFLSETCADEVIEDAITAALSTSAGYRAGVEDAARVAESCKCMNCGAIFHPLDGHSDADCPKGRASWEDLPREDIPTAISALAPPAEVSLPMDRDTLGRMVREAWVRWAQQQPAPKPSWLLPYDELSEPDKEADRQIGETVAKWTLIHESARASLAPKEAAKLETVERAAIKYDDIVIDVPKPGRHHHCFRLAEAFGKDPNDWIEQGFTTSTGRFVGRPEACRIARQAGQIVEKTDPDDVLFSEDVWPNSLPSQLLASHKGQKDGFRADDFQAALDPLLSGNETVIKAALSNNFNVIIAALRRAARNGEPHESDAGQEIRRTKPDLITPVASTGGRRLASSGTAREAPMKTDRPAASDPISAEAVKLELETTAEEREKYRSYGVGFPSQDSFETRMVRDFDRLLANSHKKTVKLETAIYDAAVKWCGEKERETSTDDIAYFRHNWRYLPGLRERVEIELGRGLLAAHKGEREDVEALRRQCAASNFHDHDGCTCTDEELVQRATPAKED